jgi:ABC-type lipoprotein release transport system permease subunit
LKAGLFLKLAILNVRRSKKTSFVIGFMVLAAVAALVFLASLAVGTNDAMIQNSVGLFTGHITGEGLPADVTSEAVHVQGIKSVLLRQKEKAWLLNKELRVPVLVLGIDPLEEKKTTDLWKKAIYGRYLNPQEKSVFIGKGTAESLKVDTGDIIELQIQYGESIQTDQFKVCGIFETGLSDLDGGLAFCPKTALPKTQSRMSAAIFLKKGMGPEPVVAALEQRFKGSRFEAWPTFLPGLKQLIDLNYVSMGIVMVLVFGVVCLGISCGFIIVILKNMREYGILKAMGVLPAEMVLMLFFQATCITAAACLGGMAVGMALVTAMATIGIDLTALTSHNPYFIVSGVIYPRLTGFSLAAPPLCALFSGWIAVIWPAVGVIREKVAQILRTV